MHRGSVSTVAATGAAYRGGVMSSIVKVIEVIAQSDKGFEDAVRGAKIAFVLEGHK